jgi:hypothetical protein
MSYRVYESIKVEGKSFLFFDPPENPIIANDDVKKKLGVA